MRRCRRAHVETLIVAHLRLVRQVALRVGRRLPAHMDRDDLISAGYVGLVQAAQRFRSDRGASFSTFASRRILGEILDYLRREGCMTRNEWRAMRVGVFVRFMDQLEDNVVDEVVADGEYLDESIWRRECHAAIERALRRRPWREAFVVRAHDLEGQPIANIRAALRLSEPGVFSVRRRALAAMRRDLEYIR